MQPVQSIAIAQINYYYTWYRTTIHSKDWVRVYSFLSRKTMNTIPWKFMRVTHLPSG
jgi:hypothetical protein